MFFTIKVEIEIVSNLLSKSQLMRGDFSWVIPKIDVRLQPLIYQVI